MDRYKLNIEPDDNGTFLVTCPALPELTTFGETEAAALAAAQDALVGIAGQYARRDIDLPPGDAMPGEAAARLPAMARAKMALARAMRRAGVTQVALARRMGIDDRQVRRLLDPHVASGLDQLEQAFATLDLALRIEVQPMAA
ncbi:HicB family protein [Zavarzinia aquatilis]|uniref:HicB family protein n=1 Tax=Zavarzinia aquatilis TaxID=2211142 RepID=A0A317EE68_9PROT|nr:HicB family protein [Zavarzinia aquatilis]PWR24556.1 HicB family protein [Zavarzinia aquatilis]